MRIVQRLLLPLLLLLFSGAPALAQGAVWTVSEAKGTVTVIDSQGTRPAKIGAPLAPGATVRTAARASAVLVRGKEFVTMRQNAQLRIAPAQRERGIVQILQDYGSALFNIGKQPNPHFGVDTPYLAAVVKGTTFVITVTNEGASLQVTEGAVETATLDGGAVELITPGSVAMIAAADPLRMVVEGEGRRVVDSPARATAPAAPAPTPSATAPAPAAGGAAESAAPPSRQALPEPASGAPDTSPRIDQAIVSTPQDLGQVSNGFASGEVVVLAAVMVSDVRGEGNAGGNSGEGSDGGSGGRPDDGVVCAGGTCTGGGAGGGADNGNAPEGAGDGNGGGADNGNPPEGAGDGNGGGADNGNPPEGAGDGNGGGADNGNPPEGAGDGNGGGADNGNPPEGAGDGNGGGDGNGPDDDGDDGDDGNDGNGNGNGSGDDGDGNGSGSSDDGDDGNGNGNGSGSDDGGNGDGGEGEVEVCLVGACISIGGDGIDTGDVSRRDSREARLDPNTGARIEQF